MPKKLDRYEAIMKGIQKHGYKYNYTKMNYINSSSKICIICPIHGEFWQRPSDHWNGCGCPKCKGVNHSNKEEFIKKARKIHGDEYIYDEVDYINNKIKVCIICPIHGKFWQRPNDHLNGYKCHYCNRPQYDTESFIQKAKEIHGDMYDYSKVNYVDCDTKVCIICPIHGEFWQTPSNHINNKTKCPICNSNKKSQMEEHIYNLLQNEVLNIERQKTFEWLKYKNYLYLDFYLPDYNIAIEVQGDQHFRPINKFGGESFFQVQQERDKMKYLLCKEHDVKLFYITKKNYNIDEIKNYINEARYKKE